PGGAGLVFALPAAPPHPPHPAGAAPPGGGGAGGGGGGPPPPHVRLDQEPLRHDLQPQHTEDEHALLAEHIVTFRLDGPLFFAAAHRFLRELSDVTGVSVVVLRLRRVTTIDASGARALGDAIARLEKRGILVYVSGIPDDGHQPLEALGVIARLVQAGQVFATTGAAIEAARERLHTSGIVPRLAG
ncbi:sodium-independent anion transporter, partial [Nonomuraea sp. NPDC048892]|uniref:sodium-independent anion transporter n=1 Tax=Nonomuraea sp. NPDC048892 TaxID=3154624 RepID=UPI0033ECC6DE